MLWKYNMVWTQIAAIQTSREVQFKSWDEMIIINFPKGMDIKDLVEIVICDTITELIFSSKC